MSPAFTFWKGLTAEDRLPTGLPGLRDGAPAPCQPAQSPQVPARSLQAWAAALLPTDPSAPAPAHPLGAWLSPLGQPHPCLSPTPFSPAAWAPPHKIEAVFQPPRDAYSSDGQSALPIVRILEDPAEKIPLYPAGFASHLVGTSPQYLSAHNFTLPLPPSPPVCLSLSL